MVSETDLLKQAFLLLDWRVSDRSASPDEEALYVQLAPLFSEAPRAAARRRADLPERAELRVQLPGYGRRSPEVHFREDRAIALSIQGAGGEWVELVTPERARGHVLHNWVSKIHGGARAFPAGSFEAGVRSGRLFARFVG